MSSTSSVRTGGGGNEPTSLEELSAQRLWNLMPRTVEDNCDRAYRKIERQCLERITAFARASAFECDFIVSPYQMDVGVFDVDVVYRRLVDALQRHTDLRVVPDARHPYKLHISWQAPNGGNGEQRTTVTGGVGMWAATAQQQQRARPLDVDLTNPNAW